MNKFISVIVVILVLLLQANLFGQDSNGTSNVKIVFEEETFDFGEVSSDTVLTHVFEFENSGTDTLFIRSVRGS